MDADRGCARVVVLTSRCMGTVSYTYLRAHETVPDLVCRLLLEKKKPYSLTSSFFFLTKPNLPYTLSTHIILPPNHTTARKQEHELN